MKQNLIFIFILIFILFACQDIITSTDDSYEGNRDLVPGGHGSVCETINIPQRIGFNEFSRAIPVPEVTPALAAVYNYDAIGDFISGYQQDDMTDTLNGYITDNYDFYEQVLKPVLSQYVDSLKTLQKYQALNCITLFIQESYQKFFGLGYYRWGGDITDRDQPQTATSHSTSKKRFGMDCSGFGASPYEVAVLLGVLDSTQNESAFSSFGFKHICENDPNISDGGGRGGTTNNYRMEVSDMYKVGRLITSISSGSTPTDAQIALMQAGDVVLKSGHMGILVEINEHLYFLESGGSTLKENGLYTPYLAKDALAHFAQSRTTSIRRCLPDMETSSGIARY
jgi:hypothetical protein